MRDEFWSLVVPGSGEEQDGNVAIPLRGRRREATFECVEAYAGPWRRKLGQADDREAFSSAGTAALSSPPENRAEIDRGRIWLQHQHARAGQPDDMRDIGGAVARC